MNPNESGANVNESASLRKALLPIFVARFIDEFGLDLAAFRVYAHLSRRQGIKTMAWPGLRSIAKICRMNKETANKAIQHLRKVGLIEAKITERKRSSYRIRSVDELMSCGLIPDSQKQKLYGLKGHQLSETKAHKVPQQGNTKLSLRDQPTDRIHCRLPSRRKTSKGSPPCDGHKE
jgi:DNA-binding transcriptional regulator YhcF (GntR family)